MAIFFSASLVAKVADAGSIDSATTEFSMGQVNGFDVVKGSVQPSWTSLPIRADDQRWLASLPDREGVLYIAIAGGMSGVSGFAFAAGDGTMTFSGYADMCPEVSRPPFDSFVDFQRSHRPDLTEEKAFRLALETEMGLHDYRGVEAGWESRPVISGDAGSLTYTNDGFTLTLSNVSADGAIGTSLLDESLSMTSCLPVDGRIPVMISWESAGGYLRAVSAVSAYTAGVSLGSLTITGGMHPDTAALFPAEQLGPVEMRFDTSGAGPECWLRS